MGFRTLLSLAPILALGAAPAASAGPKRDPVSISPRQILVTTTMSVEPNVSVTLTEYFTGEKSGRNALNLLLGVHVSEGGKKSLLASRDYNADAGGYVSRGSLEIIDLDRDGSVEILVRYHRNETPGWTRVELDVLRLVGDRLFLAWSGPVRVDTTGSSLGVPPERRERFSRELDYACTAAEPGTLCFKKVVSVAAGGVLDPPREVSERIDWGSDPEEQGGRPNSAK